MPRINTKERRIEKSPQSIQFGFREVYFVMLFVFLNLLVLLFYFSEPKALWGNHIIEFITSPFNFKEDFLKVYSSPQEGLLNNVGVPFIIAFVQVLYYHLLAQNRRIRPELVFWASVLASYLVSGLAWFLTGAPSTGTSIIGFSMIAFLFGSTLFDIPTYFRKIREGKKQQQLLAKCYIVSVVSIFSLVGLVLFYLWGNASYGYHLAGGLLCWVLVTVIVQWYGKC
jgi:hypothetical protein